MNGKMKLPVVNDRYYTVFGGPYLRKPETIFGVETLGVKLAEEIDAKCDVALDIRDFSVPDEDEAADALVDSIRLINTGQPVYFGCKGGIGRTGLMLALLAKAYGVENPVAYVREQYIPHAVETQQQQKYIEFFVIPPAATRLINYDRFWARIGSWFGAMKSMTRGAP